MGGAFFQDGTIDERVSDLELWEARALKEACTRAGGDIIPAPFRICAFAPVNVPLCFLMAQSSTMYGKLFGQCTLPSSPITITLPSPSTRLREKRKPRLR